MKRKVKSENNNKNLLIISKILNSESIEFFPFYGTLLGLIREESCIEGDDDIDLMVNIEKKEEVARLMKKYNLTQTDGGKFFSQFTYRIGRDPVIVDFYFYEEAKEFLIERWNFYGREDDQNFNVHYDKKDIFPLKEMFWKEIKLKIPQKPRDILCYCYGQSWHIKMDKSMDYVQKIKNNKIIFLENLKKLDNQ